MTCNLISIIAVYKLVCLTRKRLLNFPIWFSVLEEILRVLGERIMGRVWLRECVCEHGKKGIWGQATCEYGQAMALS